MKLPHPSAHRYESRLGKALAWVCDGIAATLVTAFVACAVAFAVWMWRGTPGFRTDYATLPASQVFAKILNQPMPTGISDVRTVGHSHLSGQVWMRFSAMSAAIDTLLESPKLKVDGPSDERRTFLPDILSEEGRAVGWPDVLKLKPVESYNFRFANSNGGWTGEIIVDRARHIVYVRAGLL
jgi:hypothetical protein